MDAREQCRGAHLRVARNRNAKLSHCMAGNGRGIEGGPKRTSEAIDGGRLAGAVGAQQAEQLALLHREPTVLDGLEAAKPFPQPVHLQRQRRAVPLRVAGDPCAAVVVPGVWVRAGAILQEAQIRREVTAPWNMQATAMRQQLGADS